jgi:transcriptional regulator with XRE-family HTH domain
MDIDTLPRPKVHHGRNIKRLRDILGVKQETIAIELDLTQQAISKLEAKEVIDDETLNKVAGILKVPVEAIKNFNDESTFSFIANTFNSHDTSIGGLAYQCTFNPIDKIIELFEENKKLYERMLEMERNKK